MTRIIVALLVTAAPTLALACPACASAQRAAPSPLYFVLMVLPFIAAGFAVRTILRALSD